MGDIVLPGEFLEGQRRKLALSSTKNPPRGRFVEFGKPWSRFTKVVSEG